jgi:hypothetical protein
MIVPPKAAFDGGRANPAAIAAGGGFNLNGALLGAGAGFLLGGVIPGAIGGVAGGIFGGGGPAPPPNGPLPFAGGRLEANIARPDGVNIPGKPSIFAGWGEVPWGSESGLAPDPGIRGTAGLALLAAALNDPCLSQTVLNSNLASQQGSFGAPTLIPQNTDPGASQGGGAGAPVQNPDPFFNPNQFLGGGR